MALDHTKVGLLITDPSLPDNPIIYANQGFTNMTGYEKDEIIGQNCRFLQGEDTSKSSIDKIRAALGQEESITLELYNYKKNGTGFWNELSIDSMWIEEEQKTYFVGVQKDITSEKEKGRLLTEALNEMEQLSTPIVPISEDISVLPLIGSIHHSRLENLTSTISNYLTKSKDDYLILDLSGLYEVDTYVASSILKLHDLTTLIGTNLVITGIRPELAIKTIDIGEKLKELRTYRTVKDALVDLN
ncbi:STAS domain-containing protein [Paraliobacillus quinghaiensis]|nr:STAS domain-containing protein [Paraliobacillus quinghaiensis]